MKNAKIIILAGQSNAVGVGHVRYLPKSYDEAEIKQFTEGYDKILINIHHFLLNKPIKLQSFCRLSAQKS